MDGGTRRVVDLPLEDSQAAIRHAVWRAIGAHYRDADERLVLVHANQQVKVEEEQSAPDF